MYFARSAYINSQKFVDIGLERRDKHIETAIDMVPALSTHVIWWLAI